MPISIRFFSRKQNNKKLSHGIIGLAIGDALGVPVEFISREQLKRNPVKDMLAYGTHDQPKGTWSDDTSLTMCLIESLLKGYNLIDISKNFINWMKSGYWSPHGVVFDIGYQTKKAILELEAIISNNDLDELHLLKYETDVNTNGNGALMRILPLYAYIKKHTDEEQFKIIRDVSALTHGHLRSAMSCYIYLKFIHFILKGLEKEIAYKLMKENVTSFFKEYEINIDEVKLFDRILKSDISNFPIEQINSGGYVLDTLEASIWCFLTTNSFEDCVLKAVNLGFDTDTTGAVSGGLAGAFYGVKNIPNQYKKDLVAYKSIAKRSLQLDKLN